LISICKETTSSHPRINILWDHLIEKVTTAQKEKDQLTPKDFWLEIVDS